MNKKIVIAVVLVIGAAGSAFYSFNALSGKSGEAPPLPLEKAEPGLDAAAKAAAPVIPDLHPPASPEEEGKDASVPQAAGETGGETVDAAEAAPPSPSRIEEILNSLIERRKRIALLQEREKAAKGPAAPGGVPGGETKRAPADPLKNLECRGILFGPGRSCALIGGYILKEGDSLPNGYQVSKINRKSVVLRQKNGGGEIVKFLEPLEEASPFGSETSPQGNGEETKTAAPAGEEGK